MFYQLLPITSEGNEWGLQMRIPILILGFKGLRLQEGMTNIPDQLLLKHTKNNRYNVWNSNSQGDEQEVFYLLSSFTDK